MTMMSSSFVFLSILFILSIVSCTNHVDFSEHFFHQYSAVLAENHVCSQVFHFQDVNGQPADFLPCTGGSISIHSSHQDNAGFFYHFRTLSSSFAHNFANFVTGIALDISHFLFIAGSLDYEYSQIHLCSWNSTLCSFHPLFLTLSHPVLLQSPSSPTSFLLVNNSDSFSVSFFDYDYKLNKRLDNVEIETCYLNGEVPDYCSFYQIIQSNLIGFNCTVNNDNHMVVICDLIEFNCRRELYLKILTINFVGDYFYGIAYTSEPTNPPNFFISTYIDEKFSLKFFSTNLFSTLRYTAETLLFSVFSPLSHVGEELLCILPLTSFSRISCMRSPFTYSIFPGSISTRGNQKVVITSGLSFLPVPNDVIVDGHVNYLSSFVDDDVIILSFGAGFPFISASISVLVNNQIIQLRSKISYQPPKIAGIIPRNFPPEGSTAYSLQMIGDNFPESGTSISFRFGFGRSGFISDISDCVVARPFVVLHCRVPKGNGRPSAVVFFVKILDEIFTYRVQLPDPLLYSYELPTVSSIVPLTNHSLNGNNFVTIRGKHLGYSTTDILRLFVDHISSSCVVIVPGVELYCSVFPFLNYTNSLVLSLMQTQQLNLSSNFQLHARSPVIFCVKNTILPTNNAKIVILGREFGNIFHNAYSITLISSSFIIPCDNPLANFDELTCWVKNGFGSGYFLSVHLDRYGELIGEEIRENFVLNFEAPSIISQEHVFIPSSGRNIEVKFLVKNVGPFLNNRPDSDLEIFTQNFNACDIILLSQVSENIVEILAKFWFFSGVSEVVVVSIGSQQSIEQSFLITSKTPKILSVIPEILNPLGGLLKIYGENLANTVDLGHSRFEASSVFNISLSAEISENFTLNFQCVGVDLIENDVIRCTYPKGNGLNFTLNINVFDHFITFFPLNYELPIIYDVSPSILFSFGGTLLLSVRFPPVAEFLPFIKIFVGRFECGELKFIDSSTFSCFVPAVDQNLDQNFVSLEFLGVVQVSEFSVSYSHVTNVENFVKNFDTYGGNLVILFDERIEEFNILCKFTTIRSNYESIIITSSFLTDKQILCPLFGFDFPSNYLIELLFHDFSVFSRVPVELSLFQVWNISPNFLLFQNDTVQNFEILTLGFPLNFPNFSVKICHLNFCKHVIVSKIRSHGISCSVELTDLSMEHKYGVILLIENSEIYCGNIEFYYLSTPSSFIFAGQGFSFPVTSSLIIPSRSLVNYCFVPLGLSLRKSRDLYCRDLSILIDTNHFLIDSAPLNFGNYNLYLFLDSIETPNFDQSNLIVFQVGLISSRNHSLYLPEIRYSLHLSVFNFVCPLVSFKFSSQIFDAPCLIQNSSPSSITLDCSFPGPGDYFLSASSSCGLSSNFLSSFHNLTVTSLSPESSRFFSSRHVTSAVPNIGSNFILPEWLLSSGVVLGLTSTCNFSQNIGSKIFDLRCIYDFVDNEFIQQIDVGMYSFPLLVYDLKGFGYYKWYANYKFLEYIFDSESFIWNRFENKVEFTGTFPIGRTGVTAATLQAVVPDESTVVSVLSLQCRTVYSGTVLECTLPPSLQFLPPPGVYSVVVRETFTVGVLGQVDVYFDGTFDPSCDFSHPPLGRNSYSAYFQLNSLTFHTQGRVFHPRKSRCCAAVEMPGCGVSLWYPVWALLTSPLEPSIIESISFSLLSNCNDVIFPTVFIDDVAIHDPLFECIPIFSETYVGTVCEYVPEMSGDSVTTVELFWPGLLNNTLVSAEVAFSFVTVPRFITTPQEKITIQTADFVLLPMINIFLLGHTRQIAYVHLLRFLPHAIIELCCQLTELDSTVSQKIFIISYDYDVIHLSNVAFFEPIIPGAYTMKIYLTEVKDVLNINLLVLPGVFSSLSHDSHVSVTPRSELITLSNLLVYVVDLTNSSCVFDELSFLDISCESLNLSETFTSPTNPFNCSLLFPSPLHGTYTLLLSFSSGEVVLTSSLDLIITPPVAISLLIQRTPFEIDPRLPLVLTISAVTYQGFTDTSYFGPLEVSLSFHSDPLAHIVTTSGSISEGRATVSLLISTLPGSLFSLNFSSGALSSIVTRDIIAQPCSFGSEPLGSGYSCVCSPGFHLERGSCSRCPVNTFKQRSGDIGCQGCPTGLVTHGKSGQTLPLACSCPEGTFSKPPSTRCFPCPHGMSCNGTSVTALDGYMLSVNQLTHDLEAVRCAIHDSCVGGRCSGAQSGSFCSSCVDGFVPVLAHCQSCDPKLLIANFLGEISFIGLFSYLFYVLNKKVVHSLAAHISFSQEFHAASDFLRVFFSHIQVWGLLVYTQVKPLKFVGHIATYSQFVTFTSPIHLVKCTFTFLVNDVGPKTEIVLTFLLAVILLFPLLVFKFLSRKQSVDVRLSTKVVSVSASSLYLLTPTILLTAFATIPCSSTSAKFYPQLECRSFDHVVHSVFLFAGVFVVYGVTNLLINLSFSSGFSSFFNSTRSSSVMNALKNRKWATILGLHSKEFTATLDFIYKLGTCYCVLAFHNLPILFSLVSALFCVLMILLRLHTQGAFSSIFKYSIQTFSFLSLFTVFLSIFFQDYIIYLSKLLVFLSALFNIATLIAFLWGFLSVLLSSEKHLNDF
ncbi:hypothetical protein RCL1_000185 [Eukaryota sp. TZLM3-RCL]